MAWVRDEREEWRLATVVSETDTDVCVLDADGVTSRAVARADAHAHDASHDLDLDDLALMTSRATAGVRLQATTSPLGSP